jgi:hypothetical protein
VALVELDPVPREPARTGSLAGARPQADKASSTKVGASARRSVRKVMAGESGRCQSAEQTKRPDRPRIVV